ERQERVQELQRAITGERYERFTGRESQVLVTGGVGEDGMIECRAPWQADDIDGVTKVRVLGEFGRNVALGGGPSAHSIAVGSLLDVHIDHVVDDYDFHATFLRVASAPGSLLGGESKRTSRTLPLVGATNASSVGSFGR
ncbi:MAG: hypothetical protein ABI120_14735, partial [Gemmatimonadaceae bacterium]